MAATEDGSPTAYSLQPTAYGLLVVPAHGGNPSASSTESPARGDATGTGRPGARTVGGADRKGGKQLFSLGLPAPRAGDGRVDVASQNQLLKSLATSAAKIFVDGHRVYVTPPGQHAAIVRRPANAGGRSVTVPPYQSECDLRTIVPLRMRLYAGISFNEGDAANRDAGPGGIGMRLAVVVYTDTFCRPALHRGRPPFPNSSQ